MEFIKWFRLASGILVLGICSNSNAADECKPAPDNVRPAFMDCYICTVEKSGTGLLVSMEKLFFGTSLISVSNESSLPDAKLLIHKPAEPTADIFRPDATSEQFYGLEKGESILLYNLPHANSPPGTSKPLEVRICNEE